MTIIKTKNGEYIDPFYGKEIRNVSRDKIRKIEKIIEEDLRKLRIEQSIQEHLAYKEASETIVGNF